MPLIDGRPAGRSGAGTAPMRITWAPSDGARPGRGERGQRVGGGRRAASRLPDSSIGARIGGAISTEAAIAACQSSLGARVTAAGWVPGAADGYTASATPAASATGSAPATRVVFLVASDREAELLRGLRGLRADPDRGRWTRWCWCRSLGVPPQPASARASDPGDRRHRAACAEAGSAGSHARRTLASAPPARRWWAQDAARRGPANRRDRGGTRPIRRRVDGYDSVPGRIGILPLA